MDSSQNILTYALIAFAIAITIHLLFGNKNQNKKITNGVKKNLQENFQEEVVEIKPIQKPKRLNNYKIKPTRPSYGTQLDFHNDKNVLEKKSHYCPLATNEADDEFYLKKFVLGTQEECGKPPQTAKEFHKDFFNFRDNTNWNSSMREDAVDKVSKLYLDGNRSEARRYPNMKIKDLFNEATKGPNLYERQCVRLPSFDNINPDGYYTSYGTPGTHLTRDNWTYNNEKIMNGGEIENNLFANDKYSNKYMDLRAYQ